MKKILFTLLLVLFTVPSLANAGVVGKGLKCEGEYYPSRDRDYPYFIYFQDELVGRNLLVVGKVISERDLTYWLKGPNAIKINGIQHSNNSFIDRESLELSFYAAGSYSFTCTIFQSYENLRLEVQKLIDERTKKNKF